MLAGLACSCGDPTTSRAPGSTHLARLAIARQGGDLKGWVQRQQAHHLLSSVSRGAQHGHADLLAGLGVGSTRRG